LQLLKWSGEIEWDVGVTAEWKLTAKELYAFNSNARDIQMLATLIISMVSCFKKG
jgi:hypothetical protein